MQLSLDQLAPGILLEDYNVIPEIDGLMDDILYSAEASVVAWNRATPMEGTYSIFIPIPDPNANLTEFDAASLLFLDGVGKVLEEAFRPHMKAYAEEFSLEESMWNPFYIFKYESPSELEVHIDDRWNSAKRLSAIYFCNDDFEGGEVEFPNFDLKFKPKKGQLLLFPSTYTYKYVLHGTTSGTRYFISTWLS